MCTVGVCVCVEFVCGKLKVASEIRIYYRRLVHFRVVQSQTRSQDHFSSIRLFLPSSAERTACGSKSMCVCVWGGIKLLRVIMCAENFNIAICNARPACISNRRFYYGTLENRCKYIELGRWGGDEERNVLEKQTKLQVFGHTIYLTRWYWLCQAARMHRQVLNENGR